MLQIRHQLVDFCSPIVLGIVNVTPDSFAEHCTALSEQSVLDQCARMLDEGADWLDIGACSTRPNGQIVSETEEKRRLEMALRAIKHRYPNVILSVDTFRANVAAWVVKEFGADIINDVSGLHDENMLHVLSASRVPYILTCPHAGASQTLSFFAHSLDRLRQAEVTDVIIDPGLGFGKNLDQNYEALRQLPVLKTFNCPVMVGLSRKSMIYTPLHCTPLEALNGTTAAHMIALMNGASILRVHDVKQAKETIQIWKKYSH